MLFGRSYSTNLQEIVIHFGPHKTATTSIQVLLRNKATEIKTHGVFIPDSSLGTAGFHELPWSIKGWDTQFICDRKESRRSREIIRDLSRDIRDSGYSRAVVSSEDFSILSFRELSNLIRHLKRYCLSKNGKILLVGANRDLISLKHSAYGQLVRLGLNKEYSEIEMDLERHFTRVFKKMRLLAFIIPRVRLSTSEYNSNNFVELWIKRYVSDQLILGSTPDVLNKSLDILKTEGLRKINMQIGINWETSRLFDWPSQHTKSSWELLQRNQKDFLHD